MKLSPRPLAAVSVLALCAACSAAPGAGESIGTSSEAITGNQIIARAQQWVTAEVPYCQSPNGQPDPDPSCASVCTRPTNSAWDPYRSDCSGFVSWAWGLPPPGLTTDELAPADTSVSEVINGSDLQPGDALNIPADHIILFVSWIVVGQSANFMEEPGCDATPNYAHAFTSNVEINGSSVSVDYEGTTFTAIRYTGTTGAGDAGSTSTLDADDAGLACTVSSTGQDGVCILTSTCSAKGGVSTPGYCPGADDIQCCTGLQVPSSDGFDAAAPPVDASTSTSDARENEVPEPAATADSGTKTAPDSATHASSAPASSSGSREPNDAIPSSGSGGCSSSGASVPSTPGWVLAVALVMARRRKRAGA